MTPKERAEKVLNTEKAYDAIRHADICALERMVADAIREAEKALHVVACKSIGDAKTLERERCATEADLVAENFRESAVLYRDEPLADYNARASGAIAVARRIREGGAS